MTEKKKDWLFLALLLVILVFCFSKILFTGKIVRAPDIINEFYWGVKSYANVSWSRLFHIDLSSAGWSPYINSGFTNEGGMASQQFLFLQKLIFKLIPAPASVAWYMVFHLFIGGAGMYCLCRSIGVSRFGSLLGGCDFCPGTGERHPDKCRPCDENRHHFLCSLGFLLHGKELSRPAG